MPTPHTDPLARWRHFLVALGFLCLYVAGPGILSQDGWGVLSIPALALWTLGASRPAKRSVCIEALTGTLLWAGVCLWAAYVWWGTLLWIGPGMGLYMAFAGILLRRFARRMPLSVAAPLAWLGSEVLRCTVPLPFGFEWMRLGVHLHALQWFDSGARALGLFGWGWIIASLGGFLADCWPRAGSTRSRAMVWGSWIGGLGPAGLAVSATWLAGPVATIPGPWVLLVQPGIPQERKMEGKHWQELLEEGLELTERGLRAAREKGIEPDIVAWGETMLPIPVLAPSLEADFDAGARVDPWWTPALEREDLEWLRRQQHDLERILFGAQATASEPARKGMLAPSTTFLFGAEHLSAKDGRIRRQNAGFAWGGPGKLQGPAGKQFIVPGAETMLGLEHVEGVRSTIRSLAGYVPDLLYVPLEQQSRNLAIETRSGAVTLGISVCFDNAFEEPFFHAAWKGAQSAAPLVHFVLSNEAWFKDNYELDQMLAFSRAAAIATGRPLVRATNSGISAVLDPGGRLLSKIVVAGRDRQVAGTLLEQVRLAQSAETTGFVFLHGIGCLRALPILMAIALGLLWRLTGPGR